MINDRSRLLERAENAKRESKSLDFKRELDTTSISEWCEIIKDIVAFANSGGGVIVFGVNNDETNSKSDVSAILSLDMADITNKIEAYTGYQFAGLEITEIERAGDTRAALIISAADIPIVFTRPGADVTVGRNKGQPSQRERYTFVTARRVNLVIAMTLLNGETVPLIEFAIAGWVAFAK